MLDEAGSASYELSEEEYARNEVEDTWVQALLAMLCAILQWLQPFLTPNNYDALVASLLEKVRAALLPATHWCTQRDLHSMVTCTCEHPPLPFLGEIASLECPVERPASQRLHATHPRRSFCQISLIQAHPWRALKTS